MTIKTPAEVARETLGDGETWHRMAHPALLSLMEAAIEADREQRDDYEAGYAEGFHHGRSTPRIGCNICGSALADGEPHLCSTDEREALIGLKLGSYTKRMPDGYPSLIMRTNEEAADVVLAAGFHRAEVPEPSADGPAFIAMMPPSPETSKRWYSMYCRVCGIEEMMADTADDPRLVARRDEHNHGHHPAPQGENS